MAIERDLPGGEEPTYTLTFSEMTAADLEEFLKRTQRGFLKAFASQVEALVERVVRGDLHRSERFVDTREDLGVG